MFADLTEWAAARMVKLGIGAAAVAFLVSSCVARDWSIENRGGEKKTHEINKANNNAAKLGSDAARKSSAPGVRGLIDPTTRND